MRIVGRWCRTLVPLAPALVPNDLRYEDQTSPSGRYPAVGPPFIRIELLRMSAPVLSDIEIQRALNQLSGWSRRTNVISKTFTMPSFPAGIAFVNRIADAAEAVQHHPDIDIRYTRITVALSTHDSGGLTQKDIDLANAIEGLAEG